LIALDEVIQMDDSKRWWEKPVPSEQQDHRLLIEGLKQPIDLRELVERAATVIIRPIDNLERSQEGGEPNGFACVFRNTDVDLEKKLDDDDYSESVKVFWFKWDKDAKWNELKDIIIRQARVELGPLVAMEEEIITRESLYTKDDRLRTIYHSKEAKDVLFNDRDSVKILLHMVKKSKQGKNKSEGSSTFHSVSIPGGKRLFGEDSLTGAIRETREETYVELKGIEPLHYIPYGATGRIFFFEMKTV
jgi:hypothetical protein